jgi:hypothetical protein
MILGLPHKLAFVTSCHFFFREESEQANWKEANCYNYLPRFVASFIRVCATFRAGN